MATQSDRNTPGMSVEQLDAEARQKADDEPRSWRVRLETFRVRLETSRAVERGRVEREELNNASVSEAASRLNSRSGESVNQELTRLWTIVDGLQAQVLELQTKQLVPGMSKEVLPKPERHHAPAICYTTEPFRVIEESDSYAAGFRDGWDASKRHHTSLPRAHEDKS